MKVFDIISNIVTWICPRYNADGTLRISERFKDAYYHKGGLV